MNKRQHKKVKLTSRLCLQVFTGQHWSFYNLPSAPSFYFVTKKKQTTGNVADGRQNKTSTSQWIWVTVKNLRHLTHQVLQGLLSPCQTRPTTPPLLPEPFSFSSFSYLVTLEATRWRQNWVVTNHHNLHIFSFCLCLPRQKVETAAIFTTLSFSSSSCLSSSSASTSTMSIGLLLPLWFWPCSCDLDRMTPCDDI